MELATALIWTLRILLPVILFCIYFKLQSPKDESSRLSGPTGHCYSREQLLVRQKAIVGCAAPEEVADITLKSLEEAPTLFASARGGRGQRGGGEGGGRERGERKERGERGDREKRDKDKDGGTAADRGAVAESEEAPMPQPAVVVVEQNATEEKMHVESLLNYVAFDRREQQRVFLPDVGAGGPPPPPPPARNARGAEDSNVSGAAANTANSEVQMVIRGAMKFSCPEVSINLYEQLIEQQVEISQSTFTLMIEACVLARELKFASDFLLKMETAGFCPESELLDKVMDLYSQQKAQREREKKEQEEANLSLDPGAILDQMFLPEGLPAGMRAKLSSQAPAFVPSFGDSDGALLSKLSTEASPFVPVCPPDAAVDGGEAPAPPVEGQRTKLKVSADAFVPNFGGVPVFDPSVGFAPGHEGGYDLYTYWGAEEDWGEWGPETGWQAQDGEGDRGHRAKKGKGEGKDKAKGKGKGKSKDGAKEKSPDAKPKAKAKVKAKEKATAADDEEGPKPKKDARQGRNGSEQKSEAKWKAKPAA